MSAVSETIVREFFELNGFFVRQHRKYIAQSRHEDEEVDFFVFNPHPRKKTLPFALTSGDLPGIERAIVVVKGWHTETFSSAVLANAPEIFRFVEPAALRRAAEGFNDGSITTILVVPALPQAEESRLESVKLLRSKGIDAVISFHTILTDLIAHTEINRNYQKSDLLQMIRVLKNYDLLKDTQLELFRPKRNRKTRKPPSAVP